MRSLLSDGHFRSVAGALKSTWESDMWVLKRGAWRKASRRSPARPRGALVWRGRTGMACGVAPRQRAGATGLTELRNCKSFQNCLKRRTSGIAVSTTRGNYEIFGDGCPFASRRTCYEAHRDDRQVCVVHPRSFAQARSKPAREGSRDRREIISPARCRSLSSPITLNLRDRFALLSGCRTQKKRLPKMGSPFATKLLRIR